MVIYVASMIKIMGPGIASFRHQTARQRGKEHKLEVTKPS